MFFGLGVVVRRVRHVVITNMEFLDKKALVTDGFSWDSPANMNMSATKSRSLSSDAFRLALTCLRAIEATSPTVPPAALMTVWIQPG